MVRGATNLGSEADLSVVISIILLLGTVVAFHYRQKYHRQPIIAMQAWEIFECETSIRIMILALCVFRQYRCSRRRGSALSSLLERFEDGSLACSMMICKLDPSRSSAGLFTNSKSSHLLLPSPKPARPPLSYVTASFLHPRHQST